MFDFELLINLLVLDECNVLDKIKNDLDIFKNDPFYFSSFTRTKADVIYQLGEYYLSQYSICTQAVDALHAKGDAIIAFSEFMERNAA